METIIGELLQEKSLYALAVILLWVAYRERESIFALFRKRQELQEKRTDAELTSEKEESEYSKTLVDRILTMLDSEQHERRALSRQIIEQSIAQSTEQAQYLSLMKGFAEIARMQSDRLGEGTAINKRLAQVLEAQWFLFVKWGVRGEDVETIIGELGRKLQAK